MKKIITIITASLVISGFAYAQDPATPNASFDTWVTVGSYQDPASWHTLNASTAILGVYTCTKATGVDVHSGTAAVKLTTKSILGIKANGFISTATPITSPPYGVSGGIPYTQRPDSITGWFKNTTLTGDTAFIEFTLKDTVSGQLVGYATFNTTGTHTTYGRFSVPITYYSNATPNLSWWNLSSSARIDTYRQVNSNLFVDDLQPIFNPLPCNTPTGLSTTNIKAASFKANCSAVTGAIQYKFRYRIKGTTTWTTLSSTTPYKNITGLTANTKYQWQVRAKCSASPLIYSPWTVSQNCTTLVAREDESLSAVSDNNSMLILYPNPASEKISLSFETGNDGIVMLSIINQVGQTVLTKKISVSDGIYNGDLNVSDLAKGIYTVRIQTDTESSIQKLIIQ